MSELIQNSFIFRLLAAVTATLRRWWQFSALHRASDWWGRACAD